MQEEMLISLTDIKSIKMFQQKIGEGGAMKILSLTVLMERESFFTIRTDPVRDRFLLNSNGGGASTPRITFLRFCAIDPNTFLSSHIST